MHPTGWFTLAIITLIFVFLFCAGYRRDRMILGRFRHIQARKQSLAREVSVFEDDQGALRLEPVLAGGARHVGESCSHSAQDFGVHIREISLPWKSTAGSPIPQAGEGRVSAIEYLGRDRLDTVDESIEQKSPVHSPALSTASSDVFRENVTTLSDADRRRQILRDKSLSRTHKVWLLIRLGLTSQHDWGALMCRDPHAQLQSHERALTLYTWLVTCLAADAIFFGVHQSSQVSLWAVVVLSSVGSKAPQRIVSFLLGKSRSHKQLRVFGPILRRFSPSFLRRTLCCVNNEEREVRAYRPWVKISTIFSA
eukprot:272391_1